MTTDIEKITDADKAYEEFANNPLLQKLGARVDRASFVAGYGTCAQHLEAVLSDVVFLLRHMAYPGDYTGRPSNNELKFRAREALSLLEKKT